MNSAVMIVGHGSRDPEGTREFLGLVERFRKSDGSSIVEYGFLEFGSPIVAEGFWRCVKQGANRITVLPAMLMAAGHTKNDIPSEIHAAQLRYSDVEFHYGRHLHLHHKIIELCKLRIEEAERGSPPIERNETLLLVVGRGSNDPDSNADIAKLARILWEGMGFGWGAACYIGITIPLPAEALQRCHRMGFARILVLPFFLFTGVLEKRIRKEIAEFSLRHPETDFLTAGYLNDHPLLCDTFRERAEEAINGTANVN